MKVVSATFASVLTVAAFCAAAPSAAQNNQASQGAFAVAGQCAWEGDRHRTPLVSALITQVVTQSVQSFASALSEAAKQHTEETSATLLFVPGRDECVQLIRGQLEIAATQDDLAAAITSIVGAQNAPRVAARLYANGARFSEPPELIIEARILPIRRSGEHGVLAVLDPTFISYREPSFRQVLRFWDRDERHFALQLQFAEAPAVPGANAIGGNVQLGSHRPGAAVHLIQPNSASPGPLASYAFLINGGALYNARLSVAESTSTSEFAQFWATALGAPAVQQAAVAEINQAINPELAASASATREQTYNTRRTALITKLNACPRSDNEAAHSWLRQERYVLANAVTAFNDAAVAMRRATVSPFGANAGLAEIITWCDATNLYLETH